MTNKDFFKQAWGDLNDELFKRGQIEDDLNKGIPDKTVAPERTYDSDAIIRPSMDTSDDDDAMLAAIIEAGNAGKR
jgi:hypothetical protein